SAFEVDFAAFCKCSHGVAVNTGTSALHLALLAAGVGPEDEVITTPYTFVATVAAIIYTGARPVLVDIEPETMTMDPRALEKKVSSNTKAIIPVHLYGQCADMAPILNLAKKYNLKVIEDACQAHAAEYGSHRAGSMGDMGCFSFYPGKNLGACGEGGMVVTNNAEYARTLRKLRNWGAEKKYNHELKGYNYRMDGIQGAILRVKLKYLEQWTEARRTNAALYDEMFAGTDVRTPVAMADRRHVYHLYAIRTPWRSALQDFLSKSCIHTGIHYPTPVHLLEAYSDLGYGIGSYPNAELAAGEVLSLPMYPELTEEMIKTVVNAVKNFCENQHGKA
uniref:DegT/DnrJ/EryC1/StrS family aminotransferase n=1 Tax=Candidatus Electrothrix sp. TaxID=2170559 RepID=UPI004056E340